MKFRNVFGHGGDYSGELRITERFIPVMQWSLWTCCVFYNWVWWGILDPDKFISHTYADINTSRFNSVYVFKTGHKTGYLGLHNH